MCSYTKSVSRIEGKNKAIAIHENINKLFDGLRKRKTKILTNTINANKDNENVPKKQTRINMKNISLKCILKTHSKVKGHFLMHSDKSKSYYIPTIKFINFKMEQQF